MPVSLRLAIRQWLARPLRPVLCALAIAAAVALVVCVGAGFDSLRASLREGLAQMLGIAEVHVRPLQRQTGARLPLSVLEQIRGRSDVALAAGRMQDHAALTKGDDHRWFDVIGVDTTVDSAPEAAGRSLDERLRPKRYVSGHALSGGANEIVIDSATAEIMKFKLGDTAEYSTNGTAKRTVTVVGIVKRPQIEFLTQPTVFVPIGSLAADLGTPVSYNVIDVKLRADQPDLEAYTKELTKALGDGASAAPSNSQSAQFEHETRSLNFGLILLSIVTGLCAALIIGTTLSVGVQERIRQFGQLRCLGASRRQLAGFVAADAALLAIVGVALGFAVGVLIAAIAIRLLPQIFLVFQLRGLSMGIALLNGIAATAVGSLIPMWQVGRITPMEAVRAVATRVRPRQVWIACLCGLAAIGLQVALWQLPGRELRFWVYACAGIPLVFVGYCLAGPAVLLLLERLGAHLIGGLLAVRPTLLRRNWSRTPWRAGAMVAALMIGVTLLTAVRTRGEGLLITWTLPDTFPDMLLFSFYGERLDHLDALKDKVPGIKDTTICSVFPVRMTRNVFRMASLSSRPESTEFVCIEPESFRRMVKLEFIEGDEESAYAELARGNAVFVSKEFKTARGIGVGDVIPLQAADGRSVDFRVAAVVTSNVIDVAKSYFDARAAVQDMSVSSVLGTVPDAQKYFKLEKAKLMLVNLDKPPGKTTQEITDAIRPVLRERGFESASGLELKDTLRRVITRVVNAMSVVAFAALCLASLGVANMVIASVHARRFEFGVLRAVGAGRGQLVRLILAEVLLVSLTAGVLGTVAGLHLAYMGTRVDRLLIGFSSRFPLTSTMALNITAGILITAVLGWLAAIVPAWRGASAAQRTLLVAGRG